MNAKKIKEIRKILGISQQQLAEMLGVTRNTIVNYEKGSVIPDAKIILLENIANGNAQYLTYKSSDSKIYDSEIMVPKDGIKPGIPYYNVDFAGGWSSEGMFAGVRPDFYINNPEFDRSDFACNLVGPSVSKLIPDGSVVGFRIIKDWKTYFPTNELYGIITENDFRTVKLVKWNKEKKKLILTPCPSDEYANRYDGDVEEIPVEFVSKFLQVMAFATFKKIAM